MKNNEYIALLVLCGTAIGFMMSIPFADTFIGGLCAAATLAGLIGGLADWFAVSAIFGRPLGISFKTDLIVSNRDRLAQGVGRMVGEELLSPESIDRLLGKKDLGAMVVRLFDKLDGQRYLKLYLTRLVQRVLAELDTKALADLVQNAVRSGVRSADWRSELAGGARWMLEEGHLDGAGRALLTEARRIAAARELHDILVRISAEALRDYENASAGRQFVNQMADLSPERCADMVTNKLSSFLAEEERAGRGAYWLSLGLLKAIEELDIDALEAAAADQIAKKVESWLTETRTAVTESPESVTWLNALVKLVHDEIDALLLDDEKNRAFNQTVRSAVCRWLSAHQEELAGLAQRGVERLPNEHLTGFLKAKVGHDLQMIRVNGSCVGALAGAALYLLRYAWKAVVL